MRLPLVIACLASSAAVAEEPFNCDAAVAYVKMATFSTKVMQGGVGGCADEVEALQGVPKAGGCGGLMGAFVEHGDLIKGAADANPSAFLVWLNEKCPTHGVEELLKY